MGYSQNCSLCKGSGTRWGWTGFILLLPLHALRMFTQSFHIFAWVIVIILCLLLVKSSLNINTELILKYFNKDINKISDDIITTIILSITAFIMLMLRLTFNYIECPKCLGTGEAVTLDELEDQSKVGTKDKQKEKN